MLGTMNITGFGFFPSLFGLAFVSCVFTLSPAVFNKLIAAIMGRPAHAAGTTGERRGGSQAQTADHNPTGRIRLLDWPVILVEHF